jgi:F-type H+-transporting ATPase subunit a
VVHALGVKEEHDASVILTSWLVVALVLGVAGLARLGLTAMRSKGPLEQYVPSTSLTPLNAMEILVETLHGVFGGTLSSKDARIFFSFLAGTFCYILFSNLVGFIPGMPPATENISTNFAMGLTVFLLFNIVGLQRQGMGYITHLAGPKLPLAMAIVVTPLVFAVETLGLFLRPVTLSIRLTANIFADHLVAGIMRDMGAGLPSFLAPIGAIVLPLPFYALGLLVCFLQAFVFTLLSTIYISLSVGHTDEHHSAEAH